MLIFRPFTIKIGVVTYETGVPELADLIFGKAGVDMYGGDGNQWTYVINVTKPTPIMVNGEYDGNICISEFIEQTKSSERIPISDNIPGYITREEMETLARRSEEGILQSNVITELLDQLFCDIDCYRHFPSFETIVREREGIFVDWNICE